MEKALLVTLKLKNTPDPWGTEERAAELCELAKSSGAEIVHEMIVKRDQPSPKYFI